MRWYLKRAAKRTIGPDKLNQIRHVRFLKSNHGIQRHMAAHRAILAPKFAAIDKALTARLAGINGLRWSKPKGGYFIDVQCMHGTAKRVVELAKTAGIALTPAGAAWQGCLVL